MKLQRVDVSARSAASPERLFALVRDGARWPEVTAIRSFSLLAPSTVEDVGAVRVFRTPPLTMHERIVALDPPDHFAYVLDRGLPIRGYRADVNLEASGTGTVLRWQATFEPAVTGTGPLFRVFLTLVLGQMARRLAKAAERP